MNGHAGRAFHFVHPDFDIVAGHPGLQFSPTGALATVEDEAAVRQSILLLLSTAPGERVMRPEYGCDLRQLLFEPNDDTTAGLAIHYVQRALDRWEPRAEVLRLDAGRHPEDAARLVIELDYRVRATQRLEQLNLSFQLTGEGV
ncbi:MAG: GPW/gp25 family protein [Verrucomicrobiales bacterium]|nr:GPW/gp25 family protein [Verrucomicrobiales bacterium]